MSPFIETIVAADPALRDRSLASLCRGLSAPQLLAACEELETFRRQAGNLYQRVRAALFAYAILRFHLQDASGVRAAGPLPHAAYADLLSRRLEQALSGLRRALREDGPNGLLLSALAACYRQLAFQTLSDQVRQSVRASRGNQWMFRVGHAEDHPVRLRGELLARAPGVRLYPLLAESTPVRLDLSHSGWSDIFFLAMDNPEGARVINLSVDLGVYGRDAEPRPPIQVRVRAIAEPVLRLSSLDLAVTKEVRDLRDLFNFSGDYLGLLKAGVIASGLTPPSFEGTGQRLDRILGRVAGAGMGIELATEVNDIPKGSRLAVSTSLLAGIVSALMRATGQTAALEGPLSEDERRLVASRAILGEWLGGSGGGWQDSGGLWPGLKLISGALAQEGDPEFGVSRGALLPQHRLLTAPETHPELPERLARSLVIFHGGMAQNVGPILEMVTEKYLLRGETEWRARQESRQLFDRMLEALRAGEVQALAGLTTAHFQGPLRRIIPWVTNRFTETVLARAKEKLGADFWGFLMLGGMSGGGMGIFVAPARQAAFRDELLEISRAVKTELEDALPFAMTPAVCIFRPNLTGSIGRLFAGEQALMPPRYYALHLPELARLGAEASSLRRAEAEHFVSKAENPAETRALLRALTGSLLRVSDPASQAGKLAQDAEAERIRREHGFDAVQHEQLRKDLRSGRLGLAHNRLPLETQVEDVADGDVRAWETLDAAARARGEEALRQGSVGVFTLAGGVGTRWTSGAGIIKALHPFIEMAGRHRGFLEIHLAKTRRFMRRCGSPLPHLVSTSFLTDAAIRKHLALSRNYGHHGPVWLSPGRSLCQRLIPMVRDLVYLWEELPQEVLDEPKQKARQNLRRALMDWARAQGEGNDYTDNVPAQRFSPPGHWYEFANLLRNGALARIWREFPRLETLMLHNLDALGADLDPAALGAHLLSGRTLTFEVVARRVGDRGGGLARVNGRPRLLEGLAQPREADELRLRFYNSMTTWIQLEPLLEFFGLTRRDVAAGAEDGPAA
jgi:hypothetical protein